MSFLTLGSSLRNSFLKQQELVKRCHGETLNIIIKIIIRNIMCETWGTNRFKVEAKFRRQIFTYSSQDKLCHI